MANKRGKRTREELANVPTWDMTPAEYERSDTPGTYEVNMPGGSVLIVSGMHTAKAAAGPKGTYRKVRN